MDTTKVSSIGATATKRLSFLSDQTAATKGGGRPMQVLDGLNKLGWPSSLVEIVIHVFSRFTDTVPTGDGIDIYEFGSFNERLTRL